MRWLSGMKPVISPPRSPMLTSRSLIGSRQRPQSRRKSCSSIDVQPLLGHTRAAIEALQGVPWFGPAF